MIDETYDAREARTNRLIADMLIALTGEESYETAMNNMLQMMAEILQADRLSVFECGRKETRITFELRADGVQPQIGMVLFLPIEALERWLKRGMKGSLALVPDTAVIEHFSKPLYDWCVENGVKCLMAAPFFNDGEIVGFLGAYNYHLNVDIDIDKLFAAVSSFIGARISNRLLIEDLEWAGKHDSLTQLLNRRGFDLAVDEHLAESPDDPLTLALIDLDDFKRINDLHGHAVGDKALLAAARTINETFPKSAIKSRNGGDEFVVVIPNKEVADIDGLIQAFAEKGVDYEGEDESKQYHMTVSVGYACYPEHNGNFKKLYPKADVALYAVKLAGKSGSMRYSNELDTRFRSRLAFTPADLAENVPCGIAIHMAGKKGELLYANDVFMQLTGYGNTPDFMDRFGGMFWGTIYHDDRERAKSTLLQHATGNDIGSVTSTQFRIAGKDGAVKNVLASSRLVNIEEVGNVFYTIVVSLDS